MGWRRKGGGCGREGTDAAETGGGEVRLGVSFDYLYLLVFSFHFTDAWLLTLPSMLSFSFLPLKYYPNFIE